MSSVYNTNNVTAGVIYRIYLQNFVTYSEVELFPGTSLNLIIGPNGTGKSTFVSAIILGLCGKTHLIGRTNKVSDFIRSGSDKATIEIELYQERGQRNVIIKRTIFKNRDISKWCIDNRDVNEDKVKKYISKFNIQVDNLCQLLPQDKVHDFSNLNPQELLKSTLSAINKEKVDQLDILIDNCKRKQSLNVRMTQIENQLKNLQRENDGLRSEYDAMQESRKLKEKLKIYKLKELWVEYSALLKNINELKNDKKNTERILKTHEKNLRDIEDKVKIYSDNIKRMTTERNSFTGKINETKNKAKQQINAIKSNEDVLRKAELSYKDILIRENNREKDIATERIKLDKLKNDKENFEREIGNVDELKKMAHRLALRLKIEETEIRKKERERCTIQYEIRSKEHDIRHCEDRIARLDDMNNNRLRILERCNQDTYQAVQWFRENQHLFQEACEPMMLLLQFAESQYAAHVEATVPRRDLLAFTFTSADDMNRFLLAVRRPPPGLGLKAVNAVCAPPREHAPRREPLLRHLGFHSYLLDKVEAPAPVLGYLRGLGLAHVPLGNGHTYEHAERVPPRITCFFTDRHKFTARTSRYSGAVVRNTQELGPTRLLAAAPDRQALAQQQHELSRLRNERNSLQEQLQEVEAALAMLRSEYNQVNEKKKSIDDKIHKEKELSALISNKTRNIQSMMNQPSAEEEKASCDRRKMEAALDQCKSHGKLCQSLKELHDYIVKRQLVTIKMSKYKEEQNGYNSKLKKCQNCFKEYKDLLNKVETDLREKTTQANEKETTLKQRCHNKLPNEKGFPYRREFENLPNDSEDLKSDRLELTTKIELIISNDQEIERYEKNLQEITDLERELSETRNVETELKQSSNTLKTQWLRDVESTIENINESFSRMFRSVKCEGKVSLEKGQSEDEFDKYGIGIWMKFRSESQLMQLSRSTQSGGERALSTALYLLALQREMRVPFRCVDEINQGMDVEYERKMLQLLIQVTTENSQYFLLTPKLLPNLHYNERVTIHTIMNGTHIMNYEEWNYEQIVIRAKTRPRNNNNLQ